MMDCLIVKGRFFVSVLFILSAIVACTKKQPAVPLTSEELIAKGKSVYYANCTSCHNIDPRKEGSIGPEIAGSSLELIEYRVLRNEYPPNYKPKRQSHSMVALPHLKDSIPALHAYLNSL